MYTYVICCMYVYVSYYFYSSQYDLYTLVSKQQKRLKFLCSELRRRYTVYVIHNQYIFAAITPLNFIFFFVFVSVQYILNILQMDIHIYVDISKS